MDDPHGEDRGGLSPASEALSVAMPIAPAQVHPAPARTHAPSRPASMLAAALTALLCLLLPAAAPASRSHDARVRAGAMTGSGACHPKGAKTPSGRRRGARRCLAAAPRVR